MIIFEGNKTILSWEIECWSFQHPSVWLPFLDNFTLQLGVSFFESMLSPFAEKEAGMSLGAVGGAFLLISLPIVFVTPVVGHVSDGGGEE